MQSCLAFAVCVLFLAVVLLVEQGTGDSISMAMSDQNDNDNSNSNDVLGNGRSDGKSEESPETVEEQACDSTPELTTTTPTLTTTVAARNWTYYHVGSPRDSNVTGWDSDCYDQQGGELGMPKTQAATDAVAAFTAIAYPGNAHLVYWMGLTCTAAACTWFDGTVVASTDFNLWGAGGLTGALTAAGSGMTFIQLTSDDTGATWHWTPVAYSAGSYVILCQK